MYINLAHTHYSTFSNNIRSLCNQMIIIGQLPYPSFYILLTSYLHVDDGGQHDIVRHVFERWYIMLTLSNGHLVNILVILTVYKVDCFSGST